MIREQMRPFKITLKELEQNVLHNLISVIKSTYAAF